MSFDIIDDILMFIEELNLNKNIELENSPEKYFEIHEAISNLCITIMKHRHVLLLDRIPQITNIFSKQLECLCFFKSGRQKDTQLSNNELQSLKSCFLKLENLMHLFASHSMELKRVAPCLLILAINLMVSNKRTTTLYPKVILINILICLLVIFRLYIFLFRLNHTLKIFATT